MKNRNFFKIILSLLILIIVGIVISNINKISVSEDYQTALSRIENGNQIVIERDISDSCFQYRVVNRGCAYTDYYLAQSTLENFNLTHGKRIELCYKFAHKGAIAYCLAMNNEREKCRDFSENNLYLDIVCDLEEEEIIPSKQFGPYNYSNCFPEGCTSLPFGSCTDPDCSVLENALDIVKYSELI